MISSRPPRQTEGDDSGEPTAWQNALRKVCRAPLVLVGEVGPAGPHLRYDGRGVFSERTFLVSKVVSNLLVNALVPGHAIVAVAASGRARLGGRSISAMTVSGSSVREGERHLLIFEKYVEETNAFVTAFDGAALWGDKAVPLGSNGYTGLTGLSPDEFVAAFEEAAARMPNRCLVPRSR